MWWLLETNFLLRFFLWSHKRCVFSYFSLANWIFFSGIAPICFCNLLALPCVSKYPSSPPARHRSVVEGSLILFSVWTGRLVQCFYSPYQGLESNPGVYWNKEAEIRKLRNFSKTQCYESVSRRRRRRRRHRCSLHVWPQTTRRFPRGRAIDSYLRASQGAALAAVDNSILRATSSMIASLFERGIHALSRWLFYFQFSV